MRKSFYLLPLIIQRFLHTGKIANIVIHLNPALCKWVKNAPFAVLLHFCGTDSFVIIFHKKNLSTPVTIPANSMGIWGLECLSFRPAPVKFSAPGCFTRKIHPPGYLS
jgi:hypothetical protein